MSFGSAQWTHAALIVGAYLLGAVPFSYILVRLRHGVDVRRRGSGNAGATNVLRVSGLPAALAVLVLDVGKGAASTAAARAAEAPAPVIGLAAFAVVAGHIFPVYIGFRGGKGVATAAGAFAVLSPTATLSAVAVFAATTALTRYVAVGSMASAAAFPLLLLTFVGEVSPWLLLGAVAVAVLVVSRHRDNIQRIRTGQEMRVGDPLSPRRDAGVRTPSQEEME